jgi:hypothetical protein
MIDFKTQTQIAVIVLWVSYFCAVIYLKYDKPTPIINCLLSAVIVPIVVALVLLLILISLTPFA